MNSTCYNFSQPFLARLPFDFGTMGRTFSAKHSCPFTVLAKWQLVADWIQYFSKFLLTIFQDGHFESAYYRALANPTDPKCAQGLIQWQHGTVVMNTDLSLSLQPFSVDGRQLQSNPCKNNQKATYQRYNQSETFTVLYIYLASKSYLLTICRNGRSISTLIRN